MNTTQTKKGALIPFWWMSWIALLLVVFGVPSLVARLVTLPGEEVRLSLLEEKEPLPEEKLEAFEAGRRRVISWFHYAPFYNDLATVALTRAGKGPVSDEALLKLQEADHWQRQGLQIAPADPYGWFRLAYLAETVQAPLEHTAQLWRQSFSSAPYEPRLLLPRLEMALRLGTALGSDGPSLIDRLIRQAWKDNPWTLARSARDGAYLSLVENALREEEGALERLQKILKEQL